MLVAVCQSMWESSNIYLFIISLLNVIIKRQTSRYLVGYLPVKFTTILESQNRHLRMASEKTLITSSDFFCLFSKLAQIDPYEM